MRTNIRAWAFAALIAGLWAGSASVHAGVPPSFTSSSAPILDPTTTWANFYRPQLSVAPTNGLAAWSTPPPEIRSLARSLVQSRFTPDQNAERVFDYVRLNIETEFQFGLGKGARGAVVSQSGTAFDQAQLMVSILAAGGIPASYQVGTITLTAQQFASWSRFAYYDATSQSFLVDARAACGFLADGGIPAQINGSSVTSCSSLSGTLSSVTLLHVWVVVNGKAYDPAYKPHVLKPGLNVPQLMGCGSSCATTLTTQALSGATQSTPGATVPTIQNLNTTAVNNQLSTYATSLQGAVQNTDRFAQVDDVLGGGSIDNNFSPQIGATLPYPSSNLDSWTHAIPDILRTKLTVSLLPLTQVLYADEIYGRKLRLFTAFSQFPSIPPGGDATNAPRTVKLVIDGDDVAAAYLTGPIPGNVTLAMDHPYAAGAGTYADQTQSFYNGASALADPNSMTLVWSLGRTGQGYQELMSAQQSQPEDINLFDTVYVNVPFAMPESAPTLAAQYLVQLDAATTLLEGAARSRISIHHVMGITIAPGQAFNLSASVSANPTQVATDKDPAFTTWSLLAAAVEGSVTQQSTDTIDPSSAVSTLWRANEADQTFLQITQDNFASAQATLTSGGYSTARLAAIQAILADRYTAADHYTLVLPAQASAAYTFSIPYTSGRQASSPVGNVTPTTDGSAAIGWRSGESTYLMNELLKGAQLAGEDPGKAALKSVELGSYSLKSRNAYSLSSVSGAMSLTPPADLVVGNGEFPASLSFQRTYSSARPPRLSCTTTTDDAAGTLSSCAPDRTFGLQAGLGWHHNLEIAAEWSNNGVEGLGATSAVRAAESIGSIYAAFDLARANTMASRLASVLVAQHMTDAFLKNSMTLHFGEKTLQFVRLPDGSYDAPIEEPAAQLSIVGTRRGPFNASSMFVYDYAAVTPQYRSSRGEVVNFAYASKVWTSDNASFNYAPPKFTVTDWTAPNGVQAKFNYTENAYDTPSPPEIPTSCGGPCIDRHYDRVLSSVTNSLGYSLTFVPVDWMFHYHVIKSVTDGSRTVSFRRAVGEAWGQPSGTPGFSFTADEPADELIVTAADSSETRYSYLPDADSPPPSGSIQPGPRLRKWKTPSSSTTPFMTFLYDEQMLLKAVRDNIGAGRTTSLFTASVSTEQDRLGETLDPTGAVTRTYANRFGKPVIEIDALGRTTKSVYNNARLVTRTTFPELNYDEFVYDVRSNLLSTTHYAKPGSGLTSLPGESTLYNEGPTVRVCSNLKTCNQPAHVYDSMNRDTAVFYNGSTGQVTSVIKPADPTGQQPRSARCYQTLSVANYPTFSLPSGLVDKVDATRTRVTRFFYNSSNHYVLDHSTVDPQDSLDLDCNAVTKSVPTPLQLTTTFTFDGIGNVTSIDMPRTTVADVTTYSFDKLRRLTRVSQPVADTYVSATAPFTASVGGKTRFTYDLDGLLVTTRRSLVANPTDSDPTNPRPTDLVSSEWQTETRTYYPNGDLETVLDGQNNLTRYAYDATGRQVLLTDPDGRRTGTVYDAVGQTICVFRAWGSDTAPTATDCSSWNPASYTGDLAPLRYAAYGYGDNGTTTSVRDAGNNQTIFSFDGFDRPTSTIFPDNSHEDFQYTVDGTVGGARCNAGKTQPCRKINRANQTIQFSYDALNRVATRTPADQGAVSYTYTLLDEPLTVNKAAFGGLPAHTTSYDYDATGRKLSETNDGRSVAYAYDEAGNRTRTTWPDSYSVTYEYDALNHLKFARESGTLELANYWYDILGRRQTLCLGGQSANCAAGGGTNRTVYAYEPDDDLDVLTHYMNAATLSFDYGHNASRQITSVAASDSFYLAAAGAGATTAYVPNNLNQYTNVGGQAVTADTKGNLTSWYPADGSGKQTFTYDSDNRLVTAAVNGSVTPSISYDYDGLGRRVSKTVAGQGTTVFLLDGDEEIAEYSGTTVLRRYVTARMPDDRITHVELTSGAPVRTYYHVNHQNSVIDMTDSDGNVTQALAYDEYGKLTSSANIGEAFRYTGQRFDPETGLYYYRARYYSPDLGRFLQPDPVGYRADVNAYVYTGDDPINRVDPTGQFDKEFFRDEENIEQDATIVKGIRNVRFEGVYFVGAHGNQNGPMYGEQILPGKHYTKTQDGWSWIKPTDILEKYPKGSGNPIILYSCFTGDGPFAEGLSKWAGATVYAPKDFAFNLELKPGVHTLISAKKTKDDRVGARSSFVAEGGGSKPFGDEITSIVIDTNTGKVDITFNVHDLSSRITKVDHASFHCTDQGVCTKN